MAGDYDVSYLCRDQKIRGKVTEYSREAAKFEFENEGWWEWEGTEKSHRKVMEFSEKILRKFGPTMQNEIKKRQDGSFLKQIRRRYRHEWMNVYNLTFRTSTEYWMTEWQLISEWVTTLAMFLWTKTWSKSIRDSEKMTWSEVIISIEDTSPGARPRIWLAGTLWWRHFSSRKHDVWRKEENSRIEDESKDSFLMDEES